MPGVIDEALTHVKAECESLEHEKKELHARLAEIEGELGRGTKILMSVNGKTGTATRSSTRGRTTARRRTTRTNGATRTNGLRPPSPEVLASIESFARARCADQGDVRIADVKEGLGLSPDVARRGVLTLVEKRTLRDLGPDESATGKPRRFNLA